MNGTKLLILLTLLFLSPYAFAQPPSCPCDTHALPNGTTGNEILEILCPGGELAEGVSYDLVPSIVRVVSNQGAGYSVQNLPNSIACGITFEGQAEGIPTTVEEAGVCRAGLIRRCGLRNIAPIPTISEWGMIATAAGLGIIGLFIAARRKKAAA